MLKFLSKVIDFDIFLSYLDANGYFLKKIYNMLFLGSSNEIH